MEEEKRWLKKLRQVELSKHLPVERAKFLNSNDFARPALRKIVVVQRCIRSWLAARKVAQLRKLRVEKYKKALASAGAQYLNESKRVRTLLRLLGRIEAQVLLDAASNGTLERKRKIAVNRSLHDELESATVSGKKWGSQSVEVEKAEGELVSRSE